MRICIFQFMRLYIGIILTIILSFPVSAGDVRLSLFSSYRDLLYPLEDGWENGFGGGFSGEALYTDNLRNELGLSVGFFENNPDVIRYIFWMQAYGTIGYEYKVTKFFSITPSIGFTINTLFFNMPGTFSLKHNQSDGPVDETEMGGVVSIRTSYYISERNSVYITSEYQRMLSNPVQPSMLYRLGFQRTFLWEFLDY